LISNLNSSAGSNLELPLTWHSFGIGSWYLNTSVYACFIMSILNCSTVADIRSNWAVVWSLWAWEARWRPSQGFQCELALFLKESVFLLNAEPKFFVFSRVKNFLWVMSEVCVGRFEYSELFIGPLEGFCHYKQVVSTSEGVRVVCNRLNNDFWVMGWCLVAWWTVVVPIWKVC
jgi:hypothetical protein